MILCILIAIPLYFLVEKLLNGHSKIKVITLYVLVDKDDRIVYSGDYRDCNNANNNLDNEFKLIKLEGVL